MSYVRLLLSGSVWQDINPFRWIFGPNAQVSLFAVNLGRSSDPDTEAAILEIASYGRQLGRMGEALLAVIEKTKTADYSNEQQRAIEDFKALMREIAAAKKRASG